MFNLHFTTALLEQVTKRHKRPKTKNFQKFQGCQVLTKLVPLDHFKDTTYRTQPLRHIQIHLVCALFVWGMCDAPALHHGSATEDRGSNA